MCTAVCIEMISTKRKLTQYRESCASLVEGTTSACSVSCQHALVGLISTAEGERLMDCTCQNPDCSLEKKRVEPCREEVIGVVESPNFDQSSTFVTSGYMANSSRHCGALLGSYCHLPGEPGMRHCPPLLQLQLQRALWRGSLFRRMQKLCSDSGEAKGCCKVGHLHM